MEWGQKPDIKNGLDRYIYHRDINPNDETIVVVGGYPATLINFACECKEIGKGGFSKGIKFVYECILAGAAREDIFYCIDNTNLSSLEKLLLKIFYVLNRNAINK